MISTEIRINGRLEVRLQPGDAMDRMVLDAMVARAGNGQPVKLVFEDDVAVVSVEAK